MTPKQIAEIETLQVESRGLVKRASILRRLSADMPDGDEADEI